MRTAIAAGLLLASYALALPEIGIVKRDKHTHGKTSHVARGLVKDKSVRRLQPRQDTVGTNVFDILTYTTGGAYYANLTVGTPAQEQTVILDTGSSDLYFDASSAATCQTTGNHSCKGGTFTPGNSNTYGIVIPAPAFDTRFGDGSTASGPFARDTVCLSDICVTNVQFGVAQQVHTTTGYSLGLMGIGYSENEATKHQYPNVPEVLKDAGEINSRLYSVYLNDASALSGSILFGGIDTSKFTGPLQTLDILPDAITGNIDQFITTVTDLSVNVGGQKTSIFSGGSADIGAYQNDNPALPVLLDTGSAAWSVPTSYYPHIVEQFPYIDNQGLTGCSNADNDDTLTVTFGGKVSINVPAREFILPIYDPSNNAPIPYSHNDQACVFMIVPSRGTGMGFDTLGDAILRSMYIVYDLDQGQVSIAQSHLNNSATSSIKVVQAGPNGVKNAVGDSYAAPPPQSSSWSIAAPISATAHYVVSTAQTTIGTATGANAVPADAQPPSSGKKKGAAAGVQVPGAVITVGLAVLFGAVGFGVML